MQIKSEVKAITGSIFPTLKNNPLARLVSLGNTKLPTSTMIFNMGSGTRCPSRRLGLCKVPAGKCYALKAERVYPGCLPYRDRQESFWLNTSADVICALFDCMLCRKKTPPKRLRFNEAGDFHSQACVDKLSIIATHLKKKWGIITYGYTARKDLSFSQATFIVRLSGHKGGKNGDTFVVPKKTRRVKGAIVCPGSCRTCHVCASAHVINVAFRIH